MQGGETCSESSDTIVPGRYALRRGYPRRVPREIFVRSGFLIESCETGQAGTGGRVTFLTALAFLDLTNSSLPQFKTVRLTRNVADCPPCFRAQRKADP
jgi:hypothetical protein